MSYVFEIAVPDPRGEGRLLWVSARSPETLFGALQDLQFEFNGVVDIPVDSVDFFLPGEANKLRLKLMEISS